MTSRRYVRPDGLVTTFHTPTVPKSARRACRSVGLRRRGSHSAASTACLLVAYLRTVTTGERPRHKSRSPPGAVPATTSTSALPIMPRRWRRSRLLLVSDRCGPCPGWLPVGAAIGRTTASHAGRGRPARRPRTCPVAARVAMSGNCAVRSFPCLDQNHSGFHAELMAAGTKSRRTGTRTTVNERRRHV